MEELRRDCLEEPTAAREDGPVVAGDEQSEAEFEFSFPSSATSDELFADGRIRASYPVFGRAFDDAHAHGRRSPLGRLFFEEARNTSVGSSSSSSSSSVDIDPDSYCVWVPGASPASSPSRPPRKSGSTWSVGRWRRVSEFVTGRSHSAGRDKFLFLSAPPSPARENKGKPRGRINGTAATELDTVAANHRMFYGAKASPGSPRRTFLPYRQDLLVGLFSKTKGLSRNHHHLI